MPTNIVFDFGAVLFAWRPAEIVRALFPAQAGTPAAAHKLAGDIFRHVDWHDFDRGTIALSALVTRTAQRLGLPHKDVETLVRAIPDYLTPIPDTVALLTRLRERRDRQRDLALYFLSNMPAPYARTLEQRHAFLDWFQGGVFSADVHLVKPQPEIFQLLQTRHGLAGARTVFIDDLPANVDAARAHGWRAIHFESAAQLEPLLDAQIG